MLERPSRKLRGVNVDAMIMEEEEEDFEEVDEHEEAIEVVVSESESSMDAAAGLTNQVEDVEEVEDGEEATEMAVPESSVEAVEGQFNQVAVDPKCCSLVAHGIGAEPVWCRASEGG